MSGPCCFTGHEHPGTPVGKIETVYGLPTYISGPSLAEAKALLVIIPDAFGWDFKNLRILADIYAKRTGARVYLPDFMDGHSADPNTIFVLDTVTSPGSWYTFFTTKIPAIFTLITTMVPFLYHNRQAVSEPRVRSWFTSLRANEGAATKIGAAGFCWGGKYVTLFCHEDAKAPSGLPLIDAGFTAHPSNLVVPGDIEKVVRPLSISVGDVDMVFSLAQINQTKEILDRKEDSDDKFEVVVLPGAKHGFAVRGHPDDEKEKEQAQVAEDQAVRWFAKWCGTSA